jgi:hypothetical protein
MMTTREAYASCDAASSTLTGFCDPTIPFPLAACGAPNAPKRTLVKERFIALLIRMARMKPLTPSSAPQTMRMVLPIAKPVALAARPA